MTSAPVCITRPRFPSGVTTHGTEQAIASNTFVLIPVALTNGPTHATLPCNHGPISGTAPVTSTDGRSLNRRTDGTGSRPTIASVASGRSARTRGKTRVARYRAASMLGG